MATRKLSAVSKVKHSGFVLVRKKPVPKAKLATVKQIAEIDWKPWKRDKGLKEGQCLPLPDSFESCYVPSRFAYAIMLMTRDDLIAMHGKVEHDHVDKLMTNMAETEEWLKGVVAMLGFAYMRVLASAAAHDRAGGKFPGVHDLRKKKRAERRA